MIQIGAKTDSVSVDRLKPVLFAFLVIAQEPPRRGRPSLLTTPKPPAPVPPNPVPLTPRPKATGSKKKVGFVLYYLFHPQSGETRRVVRDKNLVSLQYISRCWGAGARLSSSTSGATQTKYIFFHIATLLHNRNLKQFCSTH